MKGPLLGSKARQCHLLSNLEFYEGMLLWCSSLDHHTRTCAPPGHVNLQKILENPSSGMTPYTSTKVVVDSLDFNFGHDSYWRLTSPKVNVRRILVRMVSANDEGFLG